MYLLDSVKCTTIKTSVCLTFSTPRTVEDGSKVFTKFVRPRSPSLNSVPTSVTSLGDTSVTDHFNTVIPSGTLVFWYHDSRTSRSNFSGVSTLRLDTLEDPSDTGRFVIFVSTDSRPRGLGSGSHGSYTLYLYYFRVSSKKKSKF